MLQIAAEIRSGPQFHHGKVVIGRELQPRATTDQQVVELGLEAGNLWESRSLDLVHWLGECSVFGLPFLIQVAPVSGAAIGVVPPSAPDSVVTLTRTGACTRAVTAC